MSISHAEKPWQMSFPDWKQALARAWSEGKDDNVGIVSAGVAFYAFLAMVPLLGALVLTYGLVADPAQVQSHILSLAQTLPQSAAELIGEQLRNVADGSSGKKGLGLLLALGIALFGARNGAGAAITALNIAYDEDETRGFIKLNLIALAMTVGAVLAVPLVIGAMAALAALGELLPAASGATVLLGKIVSYILFLVIAMAAAAALYRFGPDRDEPRWAWITAGSLFAAVGWMLLTALFGFYVSSFGSYNATYGSLGAVVVLLTWLYLSAYVLLLGAEINAELERQTKADTTTGPAQPIGERGAHAADTVPAEANA